VRDDKETVITRRKNSEEKERGGPVCPKRDEKKDQSNKKGFLRMFVYIP
jgi:hypothetical protein